MQYTKQQREEYNRYRALTCARLGIKEHQYNWFRRKGEALHQLYEDNCNGLFESEEDYESITLPFEDEVEKKAKSFKLEVYFQTDPRGATIYLDKEPIPYNNYTQACCIY